MSTPTAKQEAPDLLQRLRVPAAPGYKSMSPKVVLERHQASAGHLGAVGLLLAKFKGLALVLLKVKFLGTALTMLVSIGAYALLFPLWFAVGIVALIWVQRKCWILMT
jgi:hypothetical protein